jgi:hypothetical protein
VAAKDGKGEQPILMSELLRAEVGAVYELKSRSTAQHGRQANARIGGGYVREGFIQYYQVLHCIGIPKKIGL